jgi:predicted metalloenzyme YecM
MYWLKKGAFMNTDNIRVIGIDQSGIKQHSTNPEFIELPFVLSRHPDETWIGICISICGSTKPLVNRRMFVLDNTIIIVANIDDDLEKYKEAIEDVVE